VSLYHKHPGVAFGDVNLSEQQIRGNHNPGAGGWPTIRYFNKETGYEGKPYVKKTQDAMCTELGNDKYMQAYVEEAGGVSLCSNADKAGCDEKSLKFLEKWTPMAAAEREAQLQRLEGMAGSSMAADLKEWVSKRIAILKSLATPSPTAKEEL
jgi:hypothetical protein